MKWLLPGLLLLTSCAVAARVGAVGAGAAAGSIAGPGGAAAGGVAGMLAYDAYKGDALQDQVTEAALEPGAVTVWAFLQPYMPWLIAAILLFTPSGQYLIRKVRQKLDRKGVS